jgi:hypothetical protein
MVTRRPDFMDSLSDETEVFDDTWHFASPPRAIRALRYGKRPALRIF